MSLRFSLERRVIPKAREQCNPKTHTIRDPKGKSVIDEAFKNANGSHCFKHQGYSHDAAQCPSRNLLVREADDEIETVVYESTGSVTDYDDEVRVSSIKLGVVRCSHSC